MNFLAAGHEVDSYSLAMALILAKTTPLQREHHRLIEKSRHGFQGKSPAGVVNLALRALLAGELKQQVQQFWPLRSTPAPDLPSAALVLTSLRLEVRTHRYYLLLIPVPKAHGHLCSWGSRPA